MTHRFLIAWILICLLVALACDRPMPAVQERTVEPYLHASGSVGFDLQPLPAAGGLHRYRATYSSQGRLAKFIIEFGTQQSHEPQGPNDFFIKTDTGRFISEPGSDASVLLADLKKALEAKSLPTKIQRASTLTFTFVNLGDNWSQAKGGGFNQKPPGHWAATKIFIGEGDYEGEVFLNLNPSIGKGEFSIKDPDYGDLVLAQLATVL